MKNIQFTIIINIRDKKNGDQRSQNRFLDRSIIICSLNYEIAVTITKTKTNRTYLVHQSYRHAMTVDNLS